MPCARTLARVAGRRSRQMETLYGLEAFLCQNKLAFANQIIAAEHEKGIRNCVGSGKDFRPSMGHLVDCIMAPFT